MALEHDASQQPNLEPAASLEDGDDALTPRPDEANADSLLIYPRAHYVDFREGRLSAQDYARDVIRHVQSQLPSRHAAAVGRARN
jgi:hypothetical protein